MPLCKSAILAERLRRQGLLTPAATDDDYRALFARLQPVSPVYFTCPGSPPSLTHRAAVNDHVLTSRWRERRELVKGRFLNGTIGYIFDGDFALYANAFRKPLERLKWVQQRVFDALETAGPLTPRQLGEETGLLNKEIMPALHRLQEAFLVYEDQLTDDNERGWYVLASEWSEVEIDETQRDAARAEVVRRFLAGYVFATVAELKDWSGWPARDLQALLHDMESRGDVVHATVADLGDGWLRTEDGNLPAADVPPCVFMLHRADPLVRAQASALKARFPGEVLQYLLIDGAFSGAVHGHWRIGPHDVDDIAVDLPAEECLRRKEAIIAAVAWGYQPPFSYIRRYAGEAL